MVVCLIPLSRDHLSHLLSHPDFTLLHPATSLATPKYPSHAPLSRGTFISFFSFVLGVILALILALLAHFNSYKLLTLHVAFNIICGVFQPGI